MLLVLFLHSIMLNSFRKFEMSESNEHLFDFDDQFHNISLNMILYFIVNALQSLKEICDLVLLWLIYFIFIDFMMD